MKRDELGVIYQMNVVPAARRTKVAATLLKAAFEGSAYGCKLYCCWCAQDLEANRFWESMGFVPIAFRAGSAAKKRVHIFWQTRINEGDVTTPWWYPFQTNSGAVREDRLVFPIPPGTHWTQVQAVAVGSAASAGSAGSAGVKRLPRTCKPAPAAAAAARSGGVPMFLRGGRRMVSAGNTWQHALALPAVIEPAATAAVPPMPPAVVPKRVTPKIDPAFIAMNRELRDRYLEQVNRDPTLLTAQARYAVCRALPSASPGRGQGILPMPLEQRRLAA